jgi:hypothetical protein
MITGEIPLMLMPSNPYRDPDKMFFPLAWEPVVDFRFATTCWEGYHFWIPGVQYIQSQ